MGRFCGEWPMFVASEWTSDAAHERRTVEA